MVPPTVFVSGTIAVLQLCQEIYLKYKSVKRYRDDCKQLCHFVSRVEGFLMETEDEEDMGQPGWQTAFVALHESLLEVGAVFEDCAKFGIVRSIVQADEMNLRLSSIAQRMTMALQLIPIQKAKAADKKLNTISALQGELRNAQFTATRAAEQQSAQLKRLMDQSKVDASKTQDMLAQVLALLQADRTSAAAAAAAPPKIEPGCGPPGGSSRPAAAAAAAGLELGAEIQDLQEELLIARKDKKIIEEQYLAQIISAIESLEVGEADLPAAAAAAADQAEAAAAAAANLPPRDLLCPITCELLADPVLLVDSYQTYERAAIEEWLGRGNTKDPVTGIKLSSSTLVPNVLVKKLAQEWLEAHPQYRRTAAAAAAAAAQHDAALPPEYVVNKTVPATAAADCGSSSSKGLAADDEFGLNPKAAALLAAVAGSSSSSKLAAPGGAPNYFDPDMLQNLDLGSSSSSRVSQEHSMHPTDLDEKTAAQRAYAAAVAAAAAQEAALPQGNATAAAYPAVRLSSQNMLARDQAAAAAAAGNSTRSLGHFATIGHAPPVAPAPAAAAAAAAPPVRSFNPTGSSSVRPVQQQQQHLSPQDEYMLWKQQQQQREAEEFALWQQQRRMAQAGSSGSSSSHLAQQTSADADAFALWQHQAHTQQQQQQQRRPSPEDLQSRVSYSEEVPISSDSSSRRGSIALPPEEQYMLLMQQQQQQQSKHDRDAQMYALWRQQQQQRGDHPQPSHKTPADLGDLHRGSDGGSMSMRKRLETTSVNEEHVTLDHFRETFAQMGKTRAEITLKHGSQEEQQRMQQQLRSQQQQQQPQQQRRSRSGTDQGVAPIHTARSVPYNQASHAGSSSSNSRASSFPGAAASVRSAASVSSSSSKGGIGGLFKKKSKPLDDDDTCSVRSESSTGTNASKKSVGQSVFGALKNISYTMVYQDDKC